MRQTLGEKLVLFGVNLHENIVYYDGQCFCYEATFLSPCRALSYLGYLQQKPKSATIDKRFKESVYL